MLRKILITLVAAVACGLLAVYLVNRHIREQEKKINAGMQMVPVIAITTDTAAGQKVTHDIIAKRDVPEKYVPANAILPKDVELVIGQTLLYPQKRGDTLMWTSLSSEAECLSSRGLSKTVTKGERALAIAVDEVGGVAGLTKPNDHIDILCTVRSEKTGEESTITLLQNISVLATGRSLASDQDEERRRGYSTLTLLVTLEEAELLVFAQKKGRLTTILRNPEDIDTRKDIPKVTFADILASEYRMNLQEKRNSIEVIKKGKTDKDR
jgi:pilus assembly protein CpaB